MNCRQLEDIITERSFAIWEREGRETGREADYWERARLEIEEEIRAALDGETGFVLPHLSISQRPVRYDGMEEREAA